MARVLVLGGGFGGISAATELRNALPEDHEILLVDRSDAFLMGLRKLWALVGLGELDEGRRPLARLEDRGIRYVRAEVLGIDAAARTVDTDSGSLAADFLIVALGAEAWRGTATTSGKRPAFPG